MRSFKEWTLTELDRTFGLHQIRTSSVLESWLAGQAEMSDLERQTLDRNPLANPCTPRMGLCEQ